jgi:hypothetical protein
MLKLFEQRPTPSLGSIQASQIHQLRVRAKSVYQTLTDYFQTSAFRLPNTHLLIQITKNLEYALDTPFDKVVETVYARAPYVARHFNLTSQISYGKYHKHVFYSSQYNDCVDYIFSNSIVDVDPFDKERKENILPNPPLPKGGDEGEEGGDFSNRKPAKKKHELTQSDIDRMQAPADGHPRNLSGLLDNLRLYHIPPSEQYAIVLKSNYGEIGGKVWKGFGVIRASAGKIKLPGHYLLSVLNN